MSKKPSMSKGVSREADELQDRIIADANASLEAGRDAFVYGPTGCGKTRMFSEVAAQRVAAGERVLVLSHRISIVKDGQRSMEKWVDRPIVTTRGLNGHVDQTGEVVYSTIQSAHENRERLDGYGTVIIDEAHHATAKNTDYIETMDALIRKNPDVKFMPTTATPPENYEGMHPRLKDADKHVITYSEAVKAKLVRLPETKCPAMVYVSHDRLEDVVQKHRKDDKSAKMIGGVNKAVARLRGPDAESWAHQEVNQFEKHLSERRSLAYFDSINEANAFIAESLSRGIPIAAIHSGQTQRENDALRDAFEDRRLKGLASVDMISEGYDIDCNGILLCKKTTSPTEYKQIIGRASRGRGEDGEPSLLVDLGASTYLHGNIAVQAQMQTIRGELERDTLSHRQLLPDAGGIAKGPWVELRTPQGERPVWATSMGKAIVYATPVGENYAVMASSKDRKGARIDLLDINGQPKGRPSREALQDWIAVGFQGNEVALARLIGRQVGGKTELERMIGDDWAKNATSIERSINMLSQMPVSMKHVQMAAGNQR